MAKQHDKQFKLDAIQYYEDHKELGLRGCANNLGIGYSTLILSILVDTLNSYKEDSYAAIGRAA